MGIKQSFKVGQLVSSRVWGLMKIAHKVGKDYRLLICNGPFSGQLSDKLYTQDEMDGWFTIVKETDNGKENSELPTEPQ